MLAYPYTSIQCNGRTILISDIINKKVIVNSRFEEELFAFMREWLGDAEHFLLNTSGSTGTPKSIYVTRHQMMISAELTAQALQLKPDQTALICLSPEFVAGKMMIVRSLTIGLRIVAVDPSSNPLENVQQQIDFSAMVPLQVHDLLHVHHHQFHNVGTVIIGGGTIDAGDIQLLQKLSCAFYATYGMTETVSHVALRSLNGPGASAHYTAMEGITFTCDDRGCLVIHWPAFGAPLTTNDVVELLDSKNFVWLGRWDNVINSGGRKILPEVLEASIANILQSTEYNMRFFVAGVPDARLGNKVVLVIESNHSDQNYSDLLNALKSSLQSFEVPREILSCSRFVETQTGKINRNTTLGFAISNVNSPD